MRLYGRDTRAATMGLAGLSLPPPNNGFQPTAAREIVAFMVLLQKLF